MATVGADLFVLCPDTRRRAWVRLVEGVTTADPKPSQMVGGEGSKRTLSSSI